jgi:hypothetical protein
MTDTNPGLPRPAVHPFTSGELLLHHRYAQGVPITCGVPHGCVTAVVEDVQCRQCREALAAFPEDPLECDHGRWNPDNRQCLDCGSPDLRQRCTACGSTGPCRCDVEADEIATGGY